MDQNERSLDYLVESDAKQLGLIGVPKVNSVDHLTGRRITQSAVHYDVKKSQKIVMIY